MNITCTWGNTVSSSFHVTNRMKQALFFPILFIVYTCMDDLSISLNNSDIGGHIGEKT